MKIKNVFFALLLPVACLGQRNDIAIPESVRMPGDSATKQQLITSVNNLLNQIEKPNNKNSAVLSSALLETSTLLDEMKAQRNSGNDSNFFKPYLASATMLSDSTCKIQIAYQGMHEGTPQLRAVFSLVGKKSNNKFLFCSPLQLNINAWKNTTIGNTVVYYKQTINDSNAGKYFNMISVYDKKLGSRIRNNTFYCADDFQEAMRLLGVDYKSDYSGIGYNAFTELEDFSAINVNGSLTSDFTRFDPHDLWHERLHNVISVDIINRPVDEGSAYLYGGSWGLSWSEILQRFKAYAKTNPTADWLALYNSSKNFEDKGPFSLHVDFVINALLVQKIDHEKGFSAVIELLSCGKKQPGNENYFAALQKITGITKKDFSKNVWILMQD